MRKFFASSLFTIALVGSCASSWFHTGPPASSFVNTQSLDVGTGGSGGAPNGSSGQFNFERTDPFTVSIWLYVTSNTTRGAIFTKDNNSAVGGYAVTYYHGGLDFFLQDAVFTMEAFEAGPSLVSLSTWHHLCNRYDGSSTQVGMHTMLDGTDITSLVGDSSLTATMMTTELPRIGYQASGFVFPGLLDQASVYSADIGSSGCTAIYNSGHPKDISTLASYSNIMAWWTLGEGSDSSTTVFDTTGTYNFTASAISYSASVP